MSLKALDLVIYSPDDIAKQVSTRENETKIGQEIAHLSSNRVSEIEANLHLASLDGARYALIGVPEDIGPRANLGRGGADGAWKSFLQFFLNSQANQFFEPAKVLLLGHVQVDDLMSSAEKLGQEGAVPVHKLRDFCAQIDDRVFPVVEQVAAAGLEPIVIGGGNNNSFPTIKGVVRALRRHGILKEGEGLPVVNCDAHADFRILEGRHSGNPFTYAHAEDFLSTYFILALQEAYNSRDMIERLTNLGFPFITYEEISVRQEISFNDAVERASEFIGEHGGRFGLELDLDIVAGVPSSAETPIGISHEEAQRYIFTMASKLEASYFHLSEAAPSLASDGNRKVGKTLSSFVLTYLKAREVFHNMVP